MPYFYIYKDAKGEFRWRYKAANNKILADSAEGYHNKSDCRHAIGVIKDEAATADLIDVSDK